MQCAQAAVEGREAPAQRRPCYFDPAHGLSVTDVEWGPNGEMPARVPACQACAAAVAHRAEPTARTVNIAGMWGVGLAGGYMIGLTDALDLSLLGLTTPLGVRGFWLAAIVGMAVADLGMLIYFLRVSAHERERNSTDASASTIEQWPLPQDERMR